MSSSSTLQEPLKSRGIRLKVQDLCLFSKSLISYVNTAPYTTRNIGWPEDEAIESAVAGTYLVGSTK